MATTLDLARRFIANAWNPGVTVTDAPADITVDWDVPIKVRDGTTLRVNVFRPSSGKLVPVVMSAHPYAKDKIPLKTKTGRGLSPQYRLLSQPRPFHISQYTGWEAPDPAFWVPRGYAVVNADLRGGGTSEGVADLFSDEEAQDYFELIEWAGTQSWSSGKVGLDGVSYLAISQYKVAALRPPHLAAICPWEGFSDLYRDFARPGGIREDGFSILWSMGTSRGARVARPLLRSQMIDRPLRDEWYQSITPDLERIQVPLLVCGSFSDHLLHSRGSFEVFRRAGSAQKRLYTHRDGKWCAYYSEEACQERLRFFDHHLKGVENGWAEELPVRLAIMDIGAKPAAVTRESAWPPQDLTWRKLWLDAQSSTMRDEPSLDHGSVNFRSQFGSVAFNWTVPIDLDIIGPMSLSLSVQVDGATDINLFVDVAKVRNGVKTTFEGSYGFGGDMVSKGWQRAAHRELDLILSTPEQPVHRHERDELLSPGEIVPVMIALRPHATRFRKGDELRVEVQGRWPYARNPFTGPFPAGYESSPKGICHLHTGAQYESHLLVGVRPYV
ncbi:acyl esterase [Neohortaea acidophila]|uniref:Acyl esterase n=1 Tax=Neohortaea acidophila TaxID=245834 RepID=A0A6A6Q0K5_9PEZI|nr:acyl esterase [Neohortaea acidophila]KAF2485561.1 acyl esterase [Neohortaea acidophila]